MVKLKPVNENNKNFSKFPPQFYCFCVYYLAALFLFAIIAYKVSHKEKPTELWQH